MPAFARVLDFAATGGYALRAYDRFRRITRDANGLWRLTHPEHAARHRLRELHRTALEQVEAEHNACNAENDHHLQQETHRHPALQQRIHDSDQVAHDHQRSDQQHDIGQPFGQA